MRADRFPLRIGALVLPDMPWSEAGPVWRTAEDLGFAHVWTYDHLTWRGHRDQGWFGAVPTLAAAAATTRRVRLGTLVGSPNFRHPVPFAKDVITLDDISDGRLVLGLGSGSVGWDATMLGRAAPTAAERAGRFAEFTDLLDRLLREPAVTHAGRWYQADEARMFPGCRQQPRVPFAIAAAGPRAMGLAARHGQVWVTTGTRRKPGPIEPREGAEDVRRQVEQLSDACAAVDRDPASIDRLVLTGPELASGLDSAASFDAVVEAYAAAGATDLVVHWPRATEPYRADLDTFLAIFSG